GRLLRRQVARRDGGPTARISRGPQGDRLRRRRQCNNRLPLGGKQARSTARVGGGPGSQAGQTDRRRGGGCWRICCPESGGGACGCCSSSPRPLSASVSSQVWPVPPATLRASISSMPNWVESSWSCCANYCPKLPASLSSSIRPIR